MTQVIFPFNPQPKQPRINSVRGRGDKTMNKTQHTPEPWYGDNISHSSLSDGHVIIPKEDYDRACKCVNDCAGIEFPKIYMSKLAYERDKARQERDQAEARYEQLRNKVIEVLDLQQKYFKTRDRDVLIQSKEAEKQLRSMAQGGLI
jgi:hypothetical protein